ncbi:MAG: hypothetical protein ACR2QV_12530 [Gammaproteobacteria bacterium]
MNTTFARLVTSLLLTVVFAAVANATEHAGAGPAATVVAFNAAIRDGDADGVAARLADGGVQFTIKSAHKGAEPDKLTTDLVPYWQMVAPVISASTAMYERDVEVLDVREMGNIATVWVQIDTKRQLKGKDAVSTASANHVYLVIDTPDGWKIAGAADNRDADDIGIGDMGG